MTTNQGVGGSNPPRTAILLPVIGTTTLPVNVTCEFIVAISVVPLDVQDNDVYARPLEWLVNGINLKQNFFLTGRAGCGKTTLIKRFIDQRADKNVIVLAPTALTAVNSGGQTIHSFFKFRPSLFRQKYHKSKFAQLNSNKQKLIRTLDVLIIDEISMVRSDVFDAIDKRLKVVRQNDLPFGGVQMILVGDLRQIAPVVTGTQHTPRQTSTKNKKEATALVTQVDKRNVKTKQSIRLVNDTGTLSINFKGTYFFDTDAFQQGNFYFISLQHVFRQKEPIFLTLLDGIRRGDIESSMKANPAIKDTLTRMVTRQKFEDIADDCTVLTPTNDIADKINKVQFEKLDTDSVSLVARYDLGFFKNILIWLGSPKAREIIYGELHQRTLIADKVLELKVGAKVVFLQNDPNKRWINGTRGTIEKIRKSLILVKKESTHEIVEVKRVTWTEYGYKHSWVTGRTKKYVKLRCKQFPIRLAYAVTIHKSQGLTLDKVFIEFGRGMFAHGQAYVAFSRARSLEGLQISRLPTNKDLRLDKEAIPSLSNLEYLEREKNQYSIGKFQYGGIDQAPQKQA